MSARRVGVDIAARMNNARIPRTYGSGRTEIVALRASSEADFETGPRITRQMEERTW
jgi:hypothetical protein